MGISKITGKEPANPITVHQIDKSNLYNSDKFCYGLTIRQQFAKDAQVSWYDAWNVLSKAYPDMKNITTNMIASTLAELKVMVADALIDELNETRK